MEALSKPAKTIRFGRHADVTHKPLIIMKIMNGVEHTSKNLMRTVQMMEIGAAEVAACVASALGVQRAWVRFMDSIFDLEVAVAGK